MKSFEDIDEKGEEFWNPYMLKNCSIEQLQAMSESFSKDNDKTKLFTAHLKQVGLLKLQTAEREKDLSKLREKLNHRFSIEMPDIFLDETEIDFEIADNSTFSIKVSIERFRNEESMKHYNVDKQGKIERFKNSLGNLRVFKLKKED